MRLSQEDLQKRYPGARTEGFGDSRDLSDRLISLIRQGKKRATCSALRDYDQEGEQIPSVGDRQIVLDWDGSPALVLEITEVTLRRFCDVDEAFALAEGEDESLDGWRAGHRAYFERNGGFTQDMMLVCERFTLVEDLAGQ